jgi:hypothetical protein
MITRAIFMSAFVFTAGAADAFTVKYPQKECAEIVSSDFSAPGSDSAYYLYEIMCKDSSGKYTTFVNMWASGSSFFGFGRASSLDRIDLVPYDGNILEIVE